MRMVRHPERIQLPHDGQGGTGGAARLPALDAGDGQAALRLDAKALEPGGYQVRCVGLVEARLGVAQDRLTQVDDLLPAVVDDPAGPGLEILPGSHGFPSFTDKRFALALPERIFQQREGRLGEGPHVGFTGPRRRSRW